MAEREAFRQAALEVAERILAAARRARDGRIFWHPPRLADDQGPRPQLDSFLYPGSTGLALFFALAGRVLERPDWRALALEILEPLRAELDRSDPRELRGRGIEPGGLAGAGSWIYGLLRIGDLAGDAGLVEDARKLSVLVDPEAEGPAELMTGRAGALLALLALAERRPEANPLGDTPLGLARRLGEGLLAGRASWQDAGPGFAHGASGIWYALARLEQRLPATAAREALGETWSAFGGDEELLRTAGRPGEDPRRFGHSWCNGATGMLLACLEQASLMGAASPLLEARLRQLAAASLDTTDHLCCGNLGRADLLIHAAARLADPVLLADARLIAGQVLARVRAEGRHRLMFHPRGEDDVRLFPGLAGLGYTFLRLAEPAALPTVLGLL